MAQNPTYDSLRADEVDKELVVCQTTPHVPTDFLIRGDAERVKKLQGGVQLSFSREKFEK